MLVGLCGYIGSGKNTASKIFIDEGYMQESFARTLKDVCSVMFSWDRSLLEGDTEESRIFRDTEDEWWSKKLGIFRFTPRLALQLIGTDVMRNHFNNGIWKYSLERRLMKSNRDVIITDARFINEIDLIKELGGKMILVRKSTPKWENVAKDALNGDKSALALMATKYSDIHRSEWEWLNTDFDYVVDNTGTKEDLEENIKLILTSM